MPFFKFDIDRLKHAIEDEDIESWYEYELKNYIKFYSSMPQKVMAFFGVNQSYTEQYRKNFDINFRNGHAYNILLKEQSFDPKQYAMQHHKLKALEALCEKGVCTWDESEVIRLFESKKPEDIAVASIFLNYPKLNKNKERNELNLTEIFSSNKHFEFIPKLINMVKTSDKFKQVSEKEKMLELSPKVLLDFMSYLDGKNTASWFGQFKEKESIYSFLSFLIRKDIFAKLDENNIIKFCSAFQSIGRNNLTLMGGWLLVQHDKFRTDCLNYFFRPYLHIVLYNLLRADATEFAKRTAFCVRDVATYLVCAGADIRKLLRLYEVDIQNSNIDYDHLTKDVGIQKIIKDAYEALQGIPDENKVLSLRKLSEKYREFNFNGKKSCLHNVNIRDAYAAENQMISTVANNEKNAPQFIYHLTTYLYLSDRINAPEEYDTDIDNEVRKTCSSLFMVLYRFKDLFNDNVNNNNNNSNTLFDKANKKAVELFNNNYEYNTTDINNVIQKRKFIHNPTMTDKCPALLFYGLPFFARARQVIANEEKRREAILGKRPY